MERFPAFFRVLIISAIRAGKHRWWVTLLIWLAAIAPSWAAALELRVAIKDGVNAVKVGSSTKAIVRDGSGRTVGEIAGMNAFVVEPTQGGMAMDRWKASQFSVEPADGGYVFIGDRWYRGRAVVVPTSKGLTAVNYVDLEQYLYSVLGGEMNGNWPQEALKAQAVAARSYALFQRQKSANGVYDVGDTTSWQVYRGLQDEAPGTQAAVNATAGQVLTYQGQIIEAVFHSSAGGCTENVENVWVQALPYLRSVADYDLTSPVAQWSKTFTQSELSSRISGVGTIRKLEVLEKTQCGRIKSMRVIGDAGSRTIKGESLRNALDLRSTLFAVNPVIEPGKEKAQNSGVVFRVDGRGFGHGLGLSQWGAYSLALQGVDYRKILTHYYQNTALAKIQVQ